MTLALPADKSIAHRALLLAALAEQPSVVDQVGAAADLRSTISCLRSLGARVEERGTSFIVSAPLVTTDDVVLDARNSGTTARLLAGWLAGRHARATVVGDASLSRRPMARVAGPVNALFVRPVIEPCSAGTLPLRVRPSSFDTSPDLVVDTGVPSAQVKSAVLIAALARPGQVLVREPAATRDHTERMLQALGAPLSVDEGGVQLSGPATLTGGWHLRVPRDPSAVALLAVASLGRRRTLIVDDVGLNPSRIAFLDVLRRMGVGVTVEPRDVRLGEPTGRIVVVPASPATSAGAPHLMPVHVAAAEIAALIDEIPALAALAALAPGTSRFEGLAELRFKESDRLLGLAEGLRGFGVAAAVEEDDLVVVGAPGRLRASPVDTRGDHRLEMSLLALAAGADLDVVAPRPSFAHVSFPGFASALRHVVA